MMKVSKELLFFLYPLYNWKECADNPVYTCCLFAEYYKNKPQELDKIIKDIININDHIQKDSTLSEKDKKLFQKAVNKLNEKPPIESMVSYIACAVLGFKNVITELIWTSKN